MERGVGGPLAHRPFVSFSPERCEAEGAREEGLREDGEGEEEEVVRRTCEAESPRLRQGIFSKVTTGSETLQRREEEEDDVKTSEVFYHTT